MDAYELIFELASIAEAAEDVLIDDYDAVIAHHSGVTTATLTCSGTSCVDAASRVLRRLLELGTGPSRVVDDLVTRTEIARRLSVTPQAVGQWIRGERQTSGVAFPKPYVVGAAELWLWGEIVEAMRARGQDVDPGVTYPTRRDIQLIAGDFAAQGVAAEYVSVLAYTGSVSSNGVVSEQRPIDSKSTDFAMAA